MSALAVIAVHVVAALVLLHQAAPRVRVVEGTPLQVMLFSEEPAPPFEIPVPTPPLVLPVIEVEMPVIDLSEVAAEPATSTAIPIEFSLARAAARGS